MFKLKNYINGELVVPHTGKYIDNYNPADGKVYSYIPDSGSADVEKAVSAAKEAFPKWSATTVEDRHDLLSAIASLIEQKLDKLAKAESLDNGKPVSLAKSVDIPRASKNFEFFAIFEQYSRRKNVGIFITFEIFFSQEKSFISFPHAIKGIDLCIL